MSKRAMMEKTWPVLSMLISFPIIVLVTGDWTLAYTSAVGSSALMVVLHRIVVGSWL